jgi:hypothetical protein
MLELACFKVYILGYSSSICHVIVTGFILTISDKGVFGHDLINHIKSVEK